MDFSVNTLELTARLTTPDAAPAASSSKVFALLSKGKYIHRNCSARELNVFLVQLISLLVHLAWRVSPDTIREERKRKTSETEHNIISNNGGP